MHVPAGDDVEAERLERVLLLLLVDLDADDPVRAAGAEVDDGRLGQLADLVRGTGPPRAGQVDQQLRGEPGCVRGQVRVDALLPAVRALGAERVALGAPEDRSRLEVRRLEEDGGRRLRHLGVEPAHDPGEGDRALGVGDHEVGRVELAQVAVQARELLARACAAHDDPASAQRLEVERVQRVPEGEHDVVRHVDDVRDRPHPGRGQARLQPRRRRRERHVAEEPADVARAALVVLDGDVRVLAARELGLGFGHGPELAPEERRHLARDPVHGEAVRPVAGHLDLEDLLPEREDVAERRPRLPRLREDEDAGVLGAELQLGLREDHAVGHRAAQLGALERPPVGKHRAGERDRHSRTGAEVPRAADDLAGLLLPHVDAAELKPVGVGVLAGLDDAADEIVAVVPVQVGDAAVGDALHLAGGDGEPIGDPRRGRVDLDVLPEPGDGDLQNCLSTRRSFSQSRPSAGRPCLSMATRSRPMPKAKPDHSSGSRPTNSNRVGSTIPEPAISIQPE